MNLSSRMKFLLLGFLVLLISIPLTLSLMQQNQDTRTRASGTTTMYLVHPPDSSTFIQKSVGETVPVNMMIDPGSNSVTFVRFQVKFDPAKLQADANNPFSVDLTKFPTILEGPIVGNGTISMSISVGSDPTKAVRNNAVKIGTVNLKAIGTTPNTQTEITFSNLTQALSSGSDDQNSENVLSFTNGASVSIIDAPVSQTPTPTITTPTITIPTNAPTPTMSPDQTRLQFNLLLHGIGSAGDNPNPNESSLSNKNPRNQQRNLTVEVFDINDQLVTMKTGTLTYDPVQGEFNGAVDLGVNFATGSYSVKIKSDRYLRKRISGIITIVHGQNNTITQSQLVAGDSNGDNTLNILDYSALLDCGYGEINPLLMTNSSSNFKQQICQVHSPAGNVDTDDNGIINSFDYNLFLRELSVQNGD